MSETNSNENNRKAKLSKLAIILVVLEVMISVILGLLGFIVFLLDLDVELNPLILGELLATSFILLPQTLGALFAVIALYQIKGTGRLLVGRNFAIAGLTISILAFPLPLWLFAERVAVYCKSQVIFINDPSRELIIELSNENKREFIDNINIVITGNIDGWAIVDTYKEMPVSENAKSAFSNLDIPAWICPDIIQERVKFEIREEWYDDKCFLKYEPIFIRSGSLKVRYYLDASPYATTD